MCCSESKSGVRTAEIITFDENDSNELKALLGKEFDEPAGGGGGGGGGVEDDLLALMDKAS